MRITTHSGKDIPPLRKFAYLGGVGYTGKLNFLCSLAEKESWYYDSPNAKTELDKKYGVLFQYIHHTFSRAQDEGKILISDACAMMNTGLFTPNGEEIFAYFIPSTNKDVPDAAPWYLKSFLKESDHEIPLNVRGNLPQYVDYFKDCPEDMYFNPNYKVFMNVDHILDENFDRLPSPIKTLPRDAIKYILAGAETTMKKKVSRNNRLAVPQYYNKKIMYLLPLVIGDDIIPLAIERHETTYRVNTIFTPGMAYCNARLVMRPESNWLVNKDR